MKYLQNKYFNKKGMYMMDMTDDCIIAPLYIYIPELNIYLKYNLHMKN